MILFQSQGVHLVCLAQLKHLTKEIYFGHSSHVIIFLFFCSKNPKLMAILGEIHFRSATHQCMLLFMLGGNHWEGMVEQYHLQKQKFNTKVIIHDTCCLSPSPFLCMPGLIWFYTTFQPYRVGICTSHMKMCLSLMTSLSSVNYSILVNPHTSWQVKEAVYPLDVSLSRYSRHSRYSNRPPFSAVYFTSHCVCFYWYS